jgi:hypothetical protein
MQKVTKLKRKRKNDWSPQKVAEYSSIINAQHNNFMLEAKVILPLSVAGIGLLVGVSNNFSFLSLPQLIAFICSVFGFFMTILFIFGIYGCKFDIFDIDKQLITNNSNSKDILIKKNKAYKRHSWFSAWIAGFFMFAILCTAVFGGISIFEKYNITKIKNEIKNKV